MQSVRFIGTTFLLAALLAACQDSGYDRGGEGAASAQDSIATAHELRASLSGATAPGKQSYSYRGLYAGMTRATLESRMRAFEAAQARCAPTAAPGTEQSCEYTAVLGPDSALVAIRAIFAADSGVATSLAREITVVRELPIAVDGVRIARGLSDAFADQTSLLDRREATYGHHSAVVHMGTMKGARQNFATVIVASKQGREELTVTLSRTGAAAPPAVVVPKKKARERR
jgi:hypothetical protein